MYALALKVALSLKDQKKEEDKQMNEETNNNDETEKKRTTRIINRQYPLCVHIYQVFVIAK